MLVLTPTSTGIDASFAQGDVVAWWFLLQIADVPINITGWKIRMTIAMKEPVVLSTDEGSIGMINSLKGQFIVNIPSSQTIDFVPGTYFYDVWVEQQVEPPIETQYITGMVTVKQSVSGAL